MALWLLALMLAADDYQVIVRDRPAEDGLDAQRRLDRRGPGFASGIDIPGNTSRQTSNSRSSYLLRDHLNRRKIAITDDRKSGFNHVHLQSSQLSRYRHFLL